MVRIGNVIKLTQQLWVYYNTWGRALNYQRAVWVHVVCSYSDMDSNCSCCVCGIISSLMERIILDLLLENRSLWLLFFQNMSDRHSICSTFCGTFIVESATRCRVLAVNVCLIKHPKRRKRWVKFYFWSIAAALEGLCTLYTSTFCLPLFSEFFPRSSALTACYCWKLRPPFPVSMKTSRILEWLF